MASSITDTFIHKNEQQGSGLEDINDMIVAEDDSSSSLLSTLSEPCSNLETHNSYSERNNSIFCCINDDVNDDDEITELKLEPIKKRSPSVRRRHKSEAAVYFEKLGIFDTEEKEKEDNNKTIDSPSSPIILNSSTFSKNPKQFALQLEMMVETLKNQKELPPKQIIIAALDILNYWILNHGITAINELEQCIDKYKSMKSENNKQKLILKHKMDEYKNEYDEYQKLKESVDDNNMELKAKLNDAEQHLKSAHFLKEQIVNLEKALDNKNRENGKNLTQRTIQQKQINTLTTDKMELQKLNDSLKSELSKMNSIDNQLKIKINEIKEIKKKYKNIQLELLQSRIEKEELYKEKQEMQNKLHDYGKLKANLKELENNQTQNMKTINSLKKTNIKLNTRINELEQSLSNISNNNNNSIDEEIIIWNEISVGNDGNDLNCLKRLNDNEKKEEIAVNDIDKTFFSFRNMKRSFVIVGISCLCYVMSVEMNKRAVNKQSSKNN